MSRTDLRLIGLAALLTLAWAGSAQATTIALPADSPKPYQRWADQSRMPIPDGLTVSNEINRCQTYLPVRLTAGCAQYSERTVVLRRWVGRNVFYHEIGHFFDHLVLTDPAQLRDWRNEFAVLFKRPDRQWRNNGDAELVEVFANVYEACSYPRLPKHRWFRGRHWENVDTGVRLKRWQVKASCSMIREAGK